MPRKARIDALGALHHAIIRGIERRKVFRSDDDRKDFLNRLSDLIPETKTECFAWAIIPKHVHLLFKSGVVPVSVIMSRLFTGYAARFNRKYRRHGQLFQNRYKSILCRSLSENERFFARSRKARKRYREFVINGISQGRKTGYAFYEAIIVINVNTQARRPQNVRRG